MSEKNEVKQNESIFEVRLINDEEQVGAKDAAVNYCGWDEDGNCSEGWDVCILYDAV